MNARILAPAKMPLMTACFLSSTAQLNFLLCASMLLPLLVPSQATAYPPILPIPRELSEHSGSFILGEDVRILVPSEASDHDLFLARFLTAELVDKFALAVHVEAVSHLPSNGRHILIGTTTNPLVQEAIAQRGLSITADSPGPEGYLLVVDKDRVIIAGSDERGAFYGLQSLRQLIEAGDGSLRVRGVTIRDWPLKTFRGVKLYVPGRENIPFFKRFLRDFMALYKFNTCVLEMNAVMRLDRHPELNAGALEFAKDMAYSRRDRPTGPGDQYQDSAHHDAGDGGILEKDEVADLVAYAKRHHIEVIPEIASLTHSYYLLSRHRELAEIQDAEWPDTYCPLRPGSYELLFDVLDEYIDVMKPNTVHVGHDEWRMPTDVCPLCKDKNPADLLVDDLLKIHTHLQAKGVKMAMWGDHLFESVSGKGLQPLTSSSGYEYKIPGALSSAQMKDRIPKDILIFNWFWSENKGRKLGVREDGPEVAELGFKQVYGNFEPTIQNYGQRSEYPDLLGGAPSSWAATTEFNIGKDQIIDFLGCANLLWSNDWTDQDRLIGMIQDRMPEVRRNLSGKNLPSQDGDKIVPVDIHQVFNASSGEDILNANLTDLKPGAVRSKHLEFVLGNETTPDAKVAAVVGAQGQKGNSLATAVDGIRIDKDVSSLIFLHACARKAKNEMSYWYIYNFDDTADMLGWYEVVYDDGFIETVPVRYGVNILEWNAWNDHKEKAYCYEAEAVPCSNNPSHALHFFAYEWVNPRPGRVIKEVRLRGSDDFRGLDNKVIQDNAVALIALSYVDKRTDFNVARAKASPNAN